MQCLYCDKDATSGKALCKTCFSKASARHSQENILAIGEALGSSGDEDGTTVEELPPHALRFLAYVTDTAIVNVVGHFIFRLLAATFFRVALPLNELVSPERDPQILQNWLQQISQLLALTCLSFTAITALYYISFECSRIQATPGKLLLGLRVFVTGRGAKLHESAKRFSIKFLPLFVPVLLVLTLRGGCLAAPLALLTIPIISLASLTAISDPLVAIFSKGRRALHDKFSGTSVAKTQHVEGGVFVSCLVILACIATQILIEFTFRS